MMKFFCFFCFVLFCINYSNELILVGSQVLALSIKLSSIIKQQKLQGGNPLNSFNRKAKSKKNQKQGKKMKLLFLQLSQLPALSALSASLSLSPYIRHYKYQQLINQHHHQPFDSVQFLFLPVVRLLNWILSLKIKDNYVVAAFFLFFSRRRSAHVARWVREVSQLLCTLTNKSE